MIAACVRGGQVNCANCHRSPKGATSHALSALVEGRLRRDVMSDEMFLFVNRTRKRAKLLFSDGTGVATLGTGAKVPTTFSLT